MTEPFRTIVADPPWAFGDKLPGFARGAARNYSTLSLSEIARFPLPPIADDARLFLWRVSAMPDEALTVCRMWGFKPKSEIVWVKLTKRGLIHFGMGRTVRLSHETCLIGQRGHPERLAKNVRSVFEAPYTRHSGKPEAFYEIVESLSPGPYLELFARSRREGWTSIGDEL